MGVGVGRIGGSVGGAGGKETLRNPAWERGRKWGKGWRCSQGGQLVSGMGGVQGGTVGASWGYPGLGERGNGVGGTVGRAVGRESLRNHDGGGGRGGATGEGAYAFRDGWGRGSSDQEEKLGFEVGESRALGVQESRVPGRGSGAQGFS